MTRYRHIVEIGAGDSHSSVAWPLSTHADRVTMFEPHDLLWADLARATNGLDHITVRRAAVSDVGGQWPLIHLGYASYLVGEPSFYATSIEPEGEPFIARLKRAVEVVTINQAVTPDVDLLVLTPNGAEARILRAMTARPKRIDTKHYCHRVEHWTEAQKVFDWMTKHNYTSQVLATNTYHTYYHLAWYRG